ncbi:MAG TPA: PLP-dependent aminotransferase family protein [Candidatus Limnocylindrales bacterium]
MSFDWATFGVDLHLEVGNGPDRRGSLERALRDAVRSGRLAPGTRLPSTRNLAAELGVARGTASAAYDQLVAEGFLRARTGSGTVVASAPMPPPSAPVAGEPARPWQHDLRPGSPDVTTFPVAEWLRCTRRALARAPMSSYAYTDPQGSMVLRQALSGYLGRARGVLAAPEQIVITSGYVQALALFSEVIDGPFATEDPGLPFHRDILLRRKRKLVPIGVDERGARTDMIPRSARAAVLTPAHQYPMGVPLHPERRHAATTWARAHGGLIIEDDYDGEFRYDRQPVGALQGVAPDAVAYVGTASKTLGPALRLAWVVLPAPLVEPFTEAKLHHDSQTATIGQLTLAEMITSHAYDRHIRSCRARYRHRRDLLAERLAGQNLLGISAGLHALIALPGPQDEERVLRRAADLGLALGDLGSHYFSRGPHPAGVIAGYGTPSEGAYPRALDALARALSMA